MFCCDPPSQRLNLTESARAGSWQTCASQNRDTENWSKAKRKTEEGEKERPACSGLTEHAWTCTCAWPHQHMHIHCGRVARAECCALRWWGIFVKYVCKQEAVQQWWHGLPCCNMDDLIYTDHIFRTEIRQENTELQTSFYNFQQPV